MINIIFLIYTIVCLSNGDEECRRKFSIRRNAIILTGSSQAKGASFLHKQVVSRFQDCYALCCNNPECTVAVFENKVNHICFLFNCKQPNVCSFTEHVNYVSMMYVKPEIKPDKYEKPKSDISKHPVDGKLGELCGPVRKCGPENSICTSGTCICQSGYIGRYGQCMRSMCPKPELMFQCHDLSKLPFCVAIYDQCNGLDECGDGSDELNCEDRSSIRRPVNKTINFAVPNKPEQKSPDPIESRQPIARVNPEDVTGDNRPRFMLRKTNSSKTSVRFHQPVLEQPRTNSHAERQLLVLESTHNNRPKYESPPSRRERMKLQRTHSKPERDSSPNYEASPYSKLKTSSYPHLTKLGEYYRKNNGLYSGPEPSSNRWAGGGSNNDFDSYYNDYEDRPVAFSGVSNRDQSSDWEDSDSAGYPDTGKYSGNDRVGAGSYSDYIDSTSDDDTYPKSQGSYMGDNYYYDNKGYSRNGFEHLMDHGNPRRTEKTHRIFVKPRPKVPLPTSVTQSIKPNEAADNRPMNNESADDSRSVQEWTTAVIVLSLGLLITAVLLIAISLKMRSWRRRLRKGGKRGKSLVTDDGDYLINGMYL